ncbi:MAG: hypothetical protein ACJ8HI_15985 [Massilia sp.]
MKKQIYVLLLSSFLMTQAANARAGETCTSIATNAQQAADRADLVIEAGVTLFFYPNDRTKPPGVIVEKPRTLYESAPTALHATMSLPADSCFPNRQQAFNGDAARRVTGKRLRFYLTKLTNSRGLRLFYMQSIDEAPPTFTKIKTSFATRSYPHPPTKPSPDGWYRARSTDGHFSIDMPGPFEDVTKSGPGQPAFMLRGADQNGTRFIAVFERAGPNAEMSGTFDDTYGKPGATTSTFKDAVAVSTKDLVPGAKDAMISNGLWFRVPGGTFMLGVVASKEHQSEALKVRDRFFNSLKFE